MTYTGIKHKQTITACDIPANNARAFTDQEKYYIKKTWKVVSNNMPGVGAKIFEKIFQLNPFVKQIFPFRELSGEEMTRDSRFRGHAFLFMQAVGASVDNIDKLDQVMGPLLINLGAKHIHFPGFKIKYFDVFVVAILDVFADELGSKFNEKVYDVWRHVFEFIISKLKEGYTTASDKEDKQ